MEKPKITPEQEIYCKSVIDKIEESKLRTGETAETQTEQSDKSVAA